MIYIEGFLQIFLFWNITLSKLALNLHFIVANELCTLFCKHGCHFMFYIFLVILFVFIYIFQIDILRKRNEYIIYFVIQ